MRYGSKRSYNKRYYKSNSKRNYKKNPTTRTLNKKIKKMQKQQEIKYRDWETDRKSTRLNSSHSGESRMPSSA